MKKALIVTFGSILAAGAMANAFADHKDFINQSSVWIEGNYTKSTNNGLSYGDYIFLNDEVLLGIGNNARRPLFVSMDREFDYALGFTYHFPCTHTRFFVSYDHFNDGQNASAENIINLGLAPNFDPYLPSNGSAYAEHDADTFKLGFNHMLHHGARFSINLGGFFEYDKVRRTVNETTVAIDDSDPAVVQRASRYTYNKVKGWGPGVGIMTRSIPSGCHPCWGVFMGANASLLYVDNDYQQTFTSTDDNRFYLYDPEETQSIVGKLDIEFGINYARILKGDLCGALVDISLGLRYMNMFNVFKNGNTYGQPYLINPGFNMNSAITLGYPNDWGRVGPFLKFKIGGAQA